MTLMSHRNSALALVLGAVATASGAGSVGGVVIGPVVGPDEWPADLAAGCEVVRMAPALRPVVEEWVFRGLEARHQRMLNVAAANAKRRGAPSVACFAPGTSAETMGAFNRAIFAFQDRFTPGPRWEVTATNPSTGDYGTPIVLTYSFVPDGTEIPNGIGEGVAPSDLFARMNAIYGGNTQQWQNLYHGVFARWGELTGVTYIYEPNDDGAVMVDADGVLGVRGDLRLGGKFIDGNSGVLAYNYYPNSGDMVIDTGDNFFENLGTNSLRLRNVLSHEHGHGMGQPHVCPVQNTKLMEPFVSTAYDGPRHDDIRGAHARYGDVNEPNGSLAQATPIGSVAVENVVTVGVPPAPAIANGSTVSIHGDGDEDWYTFTTAAGGLLTITAAPVGLAYEDAPQNCAGFSGSCCFGEFTDSASIADLVVEVYNGSGALIASSDSTGAGLVETLNAATSGGGTFSVRVLEDGAPTEPQLYTLSVQLSAAPALGLTLMEPVPTVVPAGDSVLVSVRAASAGVPVNAVQMSLYSRRGGVGPFTQAAMAHLGGGVFTGQLNTGGCGEEWQYYVQGVAGSVVAGLPATGGTGVYLTEVGEVVTTLTESFEVSPGWTVSGDAVAGAWTHGEPLGTGAQPEFDHSPDPLSNCYFTGQGTNATSAGEADVDNGSTVLTSTTFSALGVENPTIGYWRWYDNSRGGAPNTDVFTVELSNNSGGTWVTAATIGPATQNTGNWVYHQIPLAAIGMTATASMRIRFTASDLGTGSLVEAAIDDFSVFGLTCENACPADYNGDDGVDGDDVIAYFADWDAGVIGADFNGDGGVDGDDVIEFFGRWDSGC